MILEGIVTTLNEDRSPNVSPMGPRVDQAITQFELRPFKTSRTYQNLKRHGEGVFHITDDVELLARAAVREIQTPPAYHPADSVTGVILDDCCRWYSFRVAKLDDREERTSIQCQVVEHGRRRDFLGFNRAKHAVVEAAILATRLDFIPVTTIREEFERLGVIVEKTAGDQERRAFAFLQQFVAAGQAVEQPGEPTN